MQLTYDHDHDSPCLISTYSIISFRYGKQISFNRPVLAPPFTYAFHFGVIVVVNTPDILHTLYAK